MGYKGCKKLHLREYCEGFVIVYQSQKVVYLPNLFSLLKLGWYCPYWGRTTRTALTVYNPAYRMTIRYCWRRLLKFGTNEVFYWAVVMAFFFALCELPLHFPNLGHRFQDSFYLILLMFLKQISYSRSGLESASLRWLFQYFVFPAHPTPFCPLRLIGKFSPKIKSIVPESSRSQESKKFQSGPSLISKSPSMSNRIGPKLQYLSIWFHNTRTLHPTQLKNTLPKWRCAPHST